MRLLSALALIAILFAGPAWASGGSKTKAPTAESEQGTAFATPRTPSIEMPILVAPVVVNGEMDHYVYLGVTLQLVDDSHKSALLDKIPYLQDAFLREVHGPSIAHENDPSIVDEKGLIARLLAVCEKVVGANIVTGITFRNAARTN